MEMRRSGRIAATSGVSSHRNTACRLTDLSAEACLTYGARAKEVGQVGNTASALLFPP